MLPNVSAIYRDLAFMSEGGTQQRGATQAYNQPAQGFFNEKQSRHNELMEKLRNAQRESMNLSQELRGMDAQQASTSARGAYYPYDTSQHRNDYYPQANFTVTENSFSTGRGWKPPNIRYRHIEDKKPTVVHQNRTEPAIQIKAKERLQKQFYERPPRQSPEERKSVKADIAVGNQRRKEQDNMIEEASESSYGRTWANRQSKFQDKLESYYDLCRKRPVSRNVEQKEPQNLNRAKFTRTGGNRPMGMQLEKAMKLLSLD